MGHATVPSVLDGGRTVGVGLARGAVHTDNGERVTITFHAGEAALGSRLGHINTVVGDGGSHEGKEKRKNGEHIDQAKQLIMMISTAVCLSSRWCI